MYGFGYRYSPKGIYVPSGGGGVLDPDAEAFLTAATITDPTEISAVNQLVIDMKDAGIWTKMKAVYPFVGGTATTHKWNLIDPQDLDAAFRLTFSGGWTHSSTGALPNGTNGYADTYFVPSTELTGYNISMGVYLNTSALSSVVKTHIGVRTGSGQSLYFKYASSTSKQFYTFTDANTTTITGLTSSTHQGFFALSRTAQNEASIIVSNGTITNATHTTSGSLPISKIKISARGGTTTSNVEYDNQGQAFSYISEGLNDTELTNLKTAVINFQTTLGRAV